MSSSLPFGKDRSNSKSKSSNRRMFTSGNPQRNNQRNGAAPYPGGSSRQQISSISQGFNNLKIQNERDRSSRRKAKDSRRSQQVTSNGKTISYQAEKVIGNGSFGVVFLAKVAETGEVAAIKKVLQDKRFKNRELQIMKMLSHRNVVTMKHCFYSNAENDEVYLNLVLEYVPDTVYRFTKRFSKQKEGTPMVYVKLFTYQLCRSLNYIHSLGICHRDIKPQNLLIDPAEGVLKLCDFGSAKILVKGEPNVSYICSRYYRAPELIFGSTHYTTAIDTWSMGCVMAELILGRPLFPGENHVDQLVEIIKVLGAPSREEIKEMNPNHTEFKFPDVATRTWNQVFSKSNVTDEALDLLIKILRYSPHERITPIDALAHPFFDELRQNNVKLPNGNEAPSLFDFTTEELQMASNSDVVKKILPQSLWGKYNLK
eukprot:gb/GECH01014624.1/.p1 GENE.gb/GECH01014624.1/~~gb/GECH01014624.1/.p1  ORF type:complete len:428 (+),score=81.78 gb/GECH01014624.1/:1-1284(+)